MKLYINKTISAGKFYISIYITDFGAEENKKMDKFGVPSINVKPSSVYFNNKYTELIPLNGLNHSFLFNTELAANGFAATMRRRIEEAVAILKSREDKFSEIKKYEI